MSGERITHDGERERCPVHGHTRRLSRKEISEIKHAVEVANSQAKRSGKKPKEPQIGLFSCKCNCFYVKVD
ncbi:MULTISPECIES: hypothetical protein [Shewanella]|uniref:Uncharacterized protein n=1 Tax=Shewanella algae TaxID=38313 RepID=A0AAD1NPC9_9GAMM|nr:hypothetical protein [Shewanella algae]EKT4487179.1 hypothetical protein [Shewanella algae]MBO2549127.1 hypothetical protein [Shewanella algae]MBO2562249.1 hypothetical protein [Shewanella algae]MBO2566460.1 hypothetical protein [Shewanella algae]MBO2570665.1 hypothetical protein [Shewanella algae]